MNYFNLIRARQNSGISTTIDEIIMPNTFITAAPFSSRGHRSSRAAPRHVHTHSFTDRQNSIAPLFAGDRTCRRKTSNELKPPNTWVTRNSTIDGLSGCPTFFYASYHCRSAPLPQFQTSGRRTPRFFSSSSSCNAILLSRGNMSKKLINIKRSYLFI